MKALTILQPYAHLITVVQEKTVENRSWRTDYRGPLLIHAGKSRTYLNDRDETVYPGMTFGAIIGRADLYDCRRAGDVRLDLMRPIERNHVHGPHCFMLRNVVAFGRPIPWRGKQGFFDVPDEVLP